MQRTILDKRYTLLNRLGSGGMAEVYLAHDEVLDRDVALKALREQYAEDESFVERFRREARNAASLSHPNIVQVYDQGRAENGTYYMAMEYVPGGTLKDRIVEHGALAPSEAAGLAAQVAEALAVAHDRGIVHRDIKPQNVLMTPSGETKVADFGIARAASATVMTQTNLVLGTAGYMAPEQAAGEKVSPATDLYSLGVVLYEMLTGALPYEADTPIAIAMKHVNEPPRHPREANPEVPAELNAIVVRLLAKAPNERYSSAEELARDLRSVAAGTGAGISAAATTVQAPRAATQQQTRVAPATARGPVRRRRGLPVLLGLLALLLLFGGLAWAWYGAGDSGGGVEVPDVVGLEEEAARQQLTNAGLQAEVSKKESSADEVGKVLSQSVTAGESVEKGSSVRLTVGEAPSKVKVPDIPYGATEDEARTELEDLGLKRGSTSETPSDQIQAGGVVAQDPLPGVQVEPGTAVNITLSTGPSPAPAPEPTVAAPQQQAPTQQPNPEQPSSSGPGSGQPSSGSGDQGGQDLPSQDEIQKQVQDQIEGAGN
ncbi:MAG TPA: Stk1 family PASTA domain-containing Ser/Thr kinase [Rubrobacteraceae bacterium]|nr:Stk1 family PASTA domain-containing Ser/Thr kinase [Rubrobacteraceae bacterium]